MLCCKYIEISVYMLSFQFTYKFHTKFLAYQVNNYQIKNKTVTGANSLNIKYMLFEDFFTTLFLVSFKNTF
jgi:hypothetical protein